VFPPKKYFLYKKILAFIVPVLKLNAALNWLTTHLHFTISAVKKQYATIMENNKLKFLIVVQQIVQ